MIICLCTYVRIPVHVLQISYGYMQYIWFASCGRHIYAVTLVSCVNCHDVVAGKPDAVFYR